jgi:hypothetical protein
MRSHQRSGSLPSLHGVIDTAAVPRTSTPAPASQSESDAASGDDAVSSPVQMVGAPAIAGVTLRLASGDNAVSSPVQMMGTHAIAEVTPRLRRVDKPAASDITTVPAHPGLTQPSGRSDVAHGTATQGRAAGASARLNTVVDGLVSAGFSLTWDDKLG